MRQHKAFEKVSKGIFLKGKDYFIEYRDSGGRRRQEKVGPSKKLAETVFQKRMVERVEETKLDIKKPKKILLKDFVKKYLEYSKANKSPKMHIRDTFSLKQLLPALENYSLDEIQIATVEDYKIERLKKIKNGTVNREVSCLKAMLNKAVEWGILAKNPIDKIKKLREPPGRVRFLSLEELERLLAVSSFYLQTVILFVICTGLRKMELIRLRWSNIDFENSMVRVEDSKNHERCDLPLSSCIIERLKQLPRKNEFVFGGTDPRAQFENALKRAGLKNFRFHDLRHTCGSYLAINGASLVVIKEILRHKTLAMTMRYAHLCPDVKRNFVNIVSEKVNTVAINLGSRDSCNETPKE